MAQLQLLSTWIQFQSYRSSFGNLTNAITYVFRGIQADEYLKHATYNVYVKMMHISCESQTDDQGRPNGYLIKRMECLVTVPAILCSVLIWHNVSVDIVHVDM